MVPHPAARGPPGRPRAGFAQGEKRHYTRIVINRRKAVVGYITYEIARRLARRELLKRVAALRPGRPNGPNGPNGKYERQGGLLMLKRTKTAGAVATDRASALVETVRPIVQKAINDPQLHDAIRQAFATGREVTGEIQGNKPSKAARKIAEDRKLHKRVESSAQELKKAVSELVDAKPRKKGKARRAFGVIAIVGAIAGGVVLVMRKLRGEPGDDGV